MGDMRDKELLDALFGTAADAILVFDTETLELLEFNPSACELYGYSPEELSGLTLLALSAEPERTRQVVAARKDTYIAARIHRKKDGRVFPVDVAVNYFALDGRPVGVGYIRDVTERERSEEALEASEAKFAAAFRTSPDSVNLNRVSDGLYLEVNEGFTRLTGFTAEDVAGKTSAEISIWADAADRNRLVDQLRRHGEATNLEADFRLKDGSVKTGLMSARIIEIGGEPCILSVTRDISDRKTAEEALRSTNERLETMVRDVAVAMGRAVESRDPYTQGHQRRVARVGALIATEMGLPAEEIAGIDIAALLHDVGKLACPAEILSKPGQLSDVEFLLITEHARRGYDIVRDIPFPSEVALSILQHHERMDGSGYPSGLAGNEILPPARVLAVADVVEAMASHRPYRPALGLDQSIAELHEHAPKYDPEVVGACLRLYERRELGFLEG